MSRSRKGWRRVKFGEVVRLVTHRCDPIVAGIERFVGLEHLQPGDLRVRTWGLVAAGTTFTNRFRPGQVLFGKRRAYQRKVAVADFDGVCSGDIYVLETRDPETLLPGLLPFLCQTDDFFEHAVGTSAGSLSPRTNWTRLAEYEFALPPMAEQKRLATALSSVAAVHDAISELESRTAILRDAVASHWFPREWRGQARTVGEACEDLTVGIVVKPARWYVVNGDGVPALLMRNVQRGWIDTGDLTYISHAGHAAHVKSRLRTGDVVAVRSSGSVGRTGDAAVVPGELDGANAIDLLIARPGPSLRPQYLCEYLNAPSTRAALIGGSSGTMQKHLNVSELRRLPLPMRSMSEQSLAIDQLHTCTHVLRECQRRRSEAALLRGAVMRSLSSGCRQ